MQYWSPYYRKDTSELEKAQRRMIKLVSELQDLENEARFKHLRLQTLGKTRRRGDLVETYKIFNGFEDVSQQL